MSNTLRVLYAAGPGDIIGTYSHWVKGQDDPLQVSVTYSSQFFDVCRALDAQAYVISSCPQPKYLHDGRFILEHRPIPLRKASGILYHLGQLWYGLQLITSAIRFRANAAVVADGTTHWFILSLLPLLGVQVIPSLHCGLWRKHLPQRKIDQLLLKLSQYLFAYCCAAILTVSDEISEQVGQLTANQHPLIRTFSPIYKRSQFAQLNSPSQERSPFRVLFAGRIERNKGVFDLLEIAKRMQALGRQDITFDLCGNGSALEELRLAAKQAGVDSSFICHGHCNKTQMREMFNQSHAMIVPTRTDFAEGFNKVVVEGVLSGRPVVTSSVCPAVSYVREAVVEVPPDDLTAYGDALMQLCSDRKFYEQKQQSCLALQEQFYDDSRSWGTAVQSILLAIQEDRKFSKILAVEPEVIGVA
ncbi:MAG: glycosyltransferase family 4 protein [Cyanobacteriota bacterium]